jgi:outer membrane protein insertion porin family
MQTAGFRGLTFADVGSVADFNETLNLAQARASVGFGIEWLSPIGPVGLVWAFALRKQPGDITKTFEFALGSTF